ncbi:MAG TPA: alpha/beta fold hydrolase [Thermoanaerobaculia bacterium]|nr:alpha/beta fold hydrolase [Thermoanaerobaculia bacterium]
MASRSGALLLLPLLLLGPVPIVAITPAPWDGLDGPFAVERLNPTSVRDLARRRVINAAILIPEGAGPFPLIVFSHGYGGSKEHYQPITSHWASYGYVVIQPNHADSGAIRSLRDLFEVKEIWQHERPPQWRHRVADISLILDSLDELEERYPALRGKIDRARIGVAGHSYGALTTQLIAGTVSFAEDPPLRLRHAQVDAALAMSPEGMTQDLGLTERSFAAVGIPMMFMSGSLDRAAGGHPATWRKQAFEGSAPGQKYLVFIDGARHASFSGRIVQEKDRPRGFWGARRSRPPAELSGFADPEQEERIFSWIRGASLAFWDMTLKGSAPARTFLASSELTERSEGAVDLQRK